MPVAIYFLKQPSFGVFRFVGRFYKCAHSIPGKIFDRPGGRELFLKFILSRFFPRRLCSLQWNDFFNSHPNVTEKCTNWIMIWIRAHTIEFVICKHSPRGADDFITLCRRLLCNRYPAGGEKFWGFEASCSTFPYWKWCFLEHIS